MLTVIVKTINHDFTYSLFPKRVEILVISCLLIYNKNIFSEQTQNNPEI